MDVEKTIELILEHDARFAVKMEQIGERLEQVAALQVQTRADLRRAVRLGVQEARAERARRKELEAEVNAARRETNSRLNELMAAQRVTEELLQGFIRSLERGRNGH